MSFEASVGVLPQKLLVLSNVDVCMCTVWHVSLVLTVGTLILHFCNNPSLAAFDDRAEEGVIRPNTKISLSCSITTTDQFQLPEETSCCTKRVIPCVPATPLLQPCPCHFMGLVGQCCLCKTSQLFPLTRTSILQTTVWSISRFSSSLHPGHHALLHFILTLQSLLTTNKT